MHKSYYLAACCIVKNEEPFIEEWLTYHSLLGVEHFFVYDNDSAKPLTENTSIKRYISAGRLTLCQISGKPMQLPAYQHCLDTFGASCKWIAFIDLDEFICTKERIDLRLLLAEYEEYAALVLNWVTFCSNGHLNRPQGLVIENYTRLTSAQDTRNLHIKSIVQPAKVTAPKTAHSFTPKAGYSAVAENYRPLPASSPVCPFSNERIWLNHYLFKSQEDLEIKLLRGRADIVSTEPTLNHKQFYTQATNPGPLKMYAAKFIPAVKKYMAKGQVPPIFMPTPKTNEFGAYLDLAAHLASRLQIIESMLTLCHAAMLNERSANLWILRANMARHAKKYAAAERFLYQAFKYEEQLQAYLELLDLYLALGNKAKATEVLIFIKHSNTVHSSDPELLKKLEAAESLLTRLTS